MATPAQDKFLNYYHRELSYLRNAGQVFASQHPKIARRLQLSDTESPDPHTERLLESFAFLTARLSQEIDDRIPQISSALLGVLYPYLVSPVPSMAIAQFMVDPSQGKLTTGFDIARHTPVFTYAEEGVACRFRTAYPVTLWPIEVTEAEFIQPDDYVFYNCTRQSPWYLRLRLKCNGLDFYDLDLKSLRFYISGDSALSFTLYETLFAQSQIQTLVSEKDNILKELPKNSTEAIGFKVSEGLLPSPDHAHPSYQLLHEYFHFPEKFLFFDVNNLNIKDGEEYVDLLISIDNRADLDKISFGPENFRLGCTPIVNLFTKTTDPLRLDHKKFEYRLVPDQRRERTTEIYSIEQVISSVGETADAMVYNPYFSFDHTARETDPEVFWLSRRVSSERREIPGTDVYLSFVDLGFDPKVPATNTVFAQTLCTNRFLAEQVPAGGTLQLEDKAPITKIISLTKPTTQVYSPTDGETMWRLISQLSVNHLSITAGDAGLRALKETLRLYSKTGSNYAHKEIDAIESIASSPLTRRIGAEGWRGFVSGLAITLTVNERSHTGMSVFMLAAVLRHFLALQTSMNSFIELRLNSVQRQGEWMRWQPLHGEQIVL